MGKSVLITGCSESTIGNALALEFAKRGWIVYATARNTAKMANLEGNSNVKLLALDITDAKDVFAAREQISVEQGGKLDCLYHNAGVRSMSMAIDYDADEKQVMTAGEEQPYIRSDDVRMFEGNVIAVMALTRAFSKLLIAAKGTIAITGSGASRVQVPTEATYNATKAAVEMYAKTLRLELQPFGCHVVYVMTGAVATPMYFQRMTFSDDSPYKPIADRIAAGWEQGPRYVPQRTEEYARYVVERVTRMSPPKKVWCGTGIAALCWVEKFGLTWLLDGLIVFLWLKYGQPWPFSKAIKTDACKSSLQFKRSLEKKTMVPQMRVLQNGLGEPFLKQTSSIPVRFKLALAVRYMTTHMPTLKDLLWVLLTEKLIF
ncbi:hypothetical protein N7530_008354 [Penicillium desertorum]|uniref:Uncharacterized protein n=1 Tax=Penicillium desertorum TaxID=1303715 RepID=A0A9W9WP20_9EURO|nr:hypothetical protein N7530_008354 [Penicillium desertorum]